MAIEKFPVEAGHIMMFARRLAMPTRFIMTKLTPGPRRWVDHRSTDVCAGECAIRS